MLHDPNLPVSLLTRNFHSSGVQCQPAPADGAVTVHFQSALQFLIIHRVCFPLQSSEAYFSLGISFLWLMVLLAIAWLNSAITADV